MYRDMKTVNFIRRWRILRRPEWRVSNRFVWRDVRGPQMPTFSYKVFDPVFGASQGCSRAARAMTVATQVSRCYTRYSGIFRRFNRFSPGPRVLTGPTRGG